MADHGFRKVMIEKSTEELLDLIENQQHIYQHSAILDGQSILEEREIEYKVTNKIIVVKKQVSFKLFPFCVGLLLSSFGFFELSLNVSSSDALQTTIFLNVVIRFIAVIWCYDLYSKNKLTKYLWPILGLILGGWALVLISIVIYMKDTNNQYHENKL